VGGGWPQNKGVNMNLEAWSNEELLKQLEKIDQLVSGAINISDVMADLLVEESNQISQELKRRKIK
jgi:hypothetical protein